jgi:hypothetical protein
MEKKTTQFNAGDGQITVNITNKITNVEVRYDVMYRLSKNKYMVIQIVKDSRPTVWGITYDMDFKAARDLIIQRIISAGWLNTEILVQLSIINSDCMKLSMDRFYYKYPGTKPAQDQDIIVNNCPTDKLNKRAKNSVTRLFNIMQGISSAKYESEHGN